MYVPPFSITIPTALAKITVLNTFNDVLLYNLDGFRHFQSFVWGIFGIIYNFVL